MTTTLPERHVRELHSPDVDTLGQVPEAAEGFLPWLALLRRSSGVEPPRVLHRHKNPPHVIPSAVEPAPPRAGPATLSS